MLQRQGESPPVPIGGSPPSIFLQEEADGTHVGSPVTVTKPLPSLNNVDDMFLLNQHGQFSGHLKYVVTLQDGVPLWRR